VYYFANGFLWFERHLIVIIGTFVKMGVLFFVMSLFLGENAILY